MGLGYATMPRTKQKEDVRTLRRNFPLASYGGTASSILFTRYNESFAWASPLMLAHNSNRIILTADPYNVPSGMGTNVRHQTQTVKIPKR